MECPALLVAPGSVSLVTTCQPPFRAYASRPSGWQRVRAHFERSRGAWAFYLASGTPISESTVRADAAAGRLWLIHEDYVSAFPLPGANDEAPVAEPVADCAAGHALHIELARAGVRDHYDFASDVLGRPVDHLRFLSRDERNAVRAALADRSVEAAMDAHLLPM